MKTGVIVRLMKENVVIVALLFMVLIMAVISPSFRTLENLNNIMMQIAIYGIVAFGMTFAIICGEFDLSCGALMGVVTILFTDISKKSGVVPAVLACLAFCLAVGLVNGFLVAKIKMSAFVATLATSIALKGFALNYTSGKPINNVNEKINSFGNGSFLGVPVIVWFFIGVLLISLYVLRYTKFGRGIYATGGSMEVARMAGINVTFYKISIFVILGIATSVAGMLMAARLSAGNALYGNDLSMTVVAAVVIGGTLLTGGKGNALKTLWGMLVMGVLFNTLMILGVQANWQNVIRGLILIAVIVAGAVFSKEKTRIRVL
ncbi:MAG: ABC transporter permease [Treponema sp.]|jgi:ribose transport system permease protein|nr:ABC transporter permease [Treponema sp.]